MEANTGAAGRRDEYEQKKEGEWKERWRAEVRKNGRYAGGG